MGIRASGVIDDACVQNGNSFLIDRELALSLMKNKSHKYSQHPSVNRKSVQS